MRRALTCMLMLTFTLPGCAPFVGGRPLVTTQSAGCSSLLPDEWKKPVDAPPIPDGDTVGDWISYGDQATGKIDILNERLHAAITINERCEARDAAAVKKAGRGFFRGLVG